MIGGCCEREMPRELREKKDQNTTLSIFTINVRLGCLQRTIIISEILLDFI